jgi:hypothetical protein
MYLTTRRLGPFLREAGFPISDERAKKATRPSCEGGIPSVGFWGQRRMFEPDAVLRWARNLLSSEPKAIPILPIKERDRRS